MKRTHLLIIELLGGELVSRLISAINFILLLEIILSILYFCCSNLNSSLKSSSPTESSFSIDLFGTIMSAFYQLWLTCMYSMFTRIFY